jgi:hypothetical protein
VATPERDHSDANEALDGRELEVYGTVDEP